MSNFNIQELVEHVESTQQEIRGRWYPVRPCQLTGLGGLKLRIKGAIQVLLGKADTVEWSLRPIKVKKVIEPKEIDMTLHGGLSAVYMPKGFDHVSLKVHTYMLEGESIFQVPIPTLIPAWEPVLGSNIILGSLSTGRGSNIDIRYDTRNNVIYVRGPKKIEVTFMVK